MSLVFVRPQLNLRYRFFTIEIVGAHSFYQVYIWFGKCFYFRQYYYLMSTIFQFCLNLRGYLFSMAVKPKLNESSGSKFDSTQLTVVFKIKGRKFKKIFYLLGHPCIQ